MIDFYISLSVVGFIAWAFFQNGFIKNSANPTEQTRLIFPIVVPVLSGIFVYLGYILFFKHTPNIEIYNAIQNRSTLLYLLIASVGLALAYFTYTIVITADFKNAAIITVLNTIFLVLIAFFFTFENNKAVYKLNATMPQVVGAVTTVIGVVIMKFGDKFFK